MGVVLGLKLPNLYIETYFAFRMLCYRTFRGLREHFRNVETMFSTTVHSAGIGLGIHTDDILLYTFR